MQYLSVISNAVFSISCYFNLPHFVLSLAHNILCHLSVCIKVCPTTNFFLFLLILTKAFLFPPFLLMSSALVMGAPNDSCSSTGTCLSLYLPITVCGRKAEFLHGAFSFMYVFLYVCAVCIYNILCFVVVFFVLFWHNNLAVETVI